MATVGLDNEPGDDPYRELARETLTATPAVQSAVSDSEPRLF